MPPVNQGSRAGLITAVVIFVILSVAGIVFAIYFGVQRNAIQEDLDSMKRKYNAIIAENELGGEAVRALEDARKDPAFGLNESMKLIDVAREQSNALARTITGEANATPSAAKIDAQNTLANAVERLKAANVTLPSTTENLTGAIDALATTVTTLQGRVDDLTKQVADRDAQLKAKTAEYAEAQKKQADAVAAIRAEADKAISAASQHRTEKDTQVTTIQSDLQKRLDQVQEDLNKKDVELQTRVRELEALRKELELARGRLQGFRLDPKNVIVRQPDGEIVRVPGGGIVYVNLGSGQQVSPGMTFQVYDKAEGIPGLPPAGDEQAGELPEGKASIEIIRVGNTSSEARIIDQRRGTQISEGDLVANLVYDANTKYNFLVYGNFDLDQNNVPTPGDAEVIKRLITQWGGTVMDQISVDTDFVVLGKEPVIPTFTDEELQDAFNLKRLQDAQAALDAYLDIVQKAQSLHIPILNQNRFLYYVGYYEQARR